MMLDIAYVSTYVPKKCGLATYTHHLQNCVQNAAKNTPVRNHVIAIQGPDEPRTMYSQSLWMLQRDRREDYERVATKINNSSIDLVSLQHEFGIFGGTAESISSDLRGLCESRLLPHFIRCLNVQVLRIRIFSNNSLNSVIISL